MNPTHSLSPKKTIQWKELHSDPITIDFNSTTTPWLESIIAQADEEKIAQKRLSNVKFQIYKMDTLATLKGELTTHVWLLCSRCAKSLKFPIETHFTHLFCINPELAKTRPFEAEDESHPVSGRVHGFAKSAHHEKEDSETNTEELDITHLPDETIHFDSVIREQLSLEIPFQPLCTPKCLGICANCGTDLNKSKCSCKPTQNEREHPFLKLKNLKLK